MLHRFLFDTPYYRVPEIAALQGNPARTREVCLERLTRLLPVLGDHLVPVWSSASLPSQPLALTVFRTKDEESLLAVACESGLLAVTDAKQGEGWANLQLPDVFPRGSRIQNLWASGALRLFGPWIELLVSVVPSERSRAPYVYRAMVRVVGGTIELEPASEDTGPSASTRRRWQDFRLPESFRWLETGRVFCTGGADPFDPMAALYRSPNLLRIADGEGVLMAYGQSRYAWVEAGSRLCGYDRKGSLIAHGLGTTVQAILCLPDPPERLRVVLATDQRRLEAFELLDGHWSHAWSQPLRHQVLALDCLPQTCNEQPWPDIFLATSTRKLVRFSALGAMATQKRWNAEADRLAELEHLRDAADWVNFCNTALKTLQGSETKLEIQAQRRLLHHLAIDRTLRSGELSEELIGKIGRLWGEERQAALLLSAARRLEEALAEWETQGPATDDSIPELVWACYDHKPFRIQEVFDSHVRAVPAELRTSLAERFPAYAKLSQASDDVVAFFEPQDPLRRAGIHLLRAVERFVTAGFHLRKGVESGYRLLVPVYHRGGHRLAAVANSRLDLYELNEIDSPSASFEMRLVASHQFDTSFVAEFAEPICSSSGRDYLVLGSRQGHLAFLDLEAPHDQGLCLQIKSLGGSLLAASPIPEAVGSRPQTLWVARNRSERADLFRVEIDSQGRPLISEPQETSLHRIQALFAFGGENIGSFLAAEYDSLVLLELPADGLGKLSTDQRSRHLGSEVITLSGLPGRSGELEIACGTRSGQIFFLDFLRKPEIWKRIPWVFYADRGVIQGLARAAGDQRIGIVSGKGQVLLLDREGRVLFQYTPEHPAEAAALLPADKAEESEYLIVANESWGLTALRSTGSPSHFLAVARTALLEVSSSPQGRQQNEIAEIGTVLQRYDLGEPAHEIYRSVTYPVSRKALLWLLATQLPTGTEIDKALLEELPPEDLVLLLREAPQERVLPLLDPIWKRLTSDPHFRSYPEATSAFYEILRLSSWKEASYLQSEMIRNLLKDLDKEWAPYLVASHQLREAAIGLGNAQLFSALLDRLVRLPLPVARAMSSWLLFVKDHRHVGAAPLRSLVQLGEALARNARNEEVEAVLQDLSSSLAPLGEPQANAAIAPAVKLFARYLSLLVSNGAESAATEQPWKQFLEILEDSRQQSGEGALDLLLFRSIAQWRPRQPPGPESTLTAWRDWLRELRQRLETLEADQTHTLDDLREAFQPDDAWLALCGELLRRGRQELESLLRVERTELQNRVLLHLKVTDTRRPTRLEAEIELAITAEASQPVERLSYALDLSSPGGLGPTGEALQRRGEIPILEPYHLTRPEVWRVRGTLLPDQKQVTAAIILTWDRSSVEYKCALPLRTAPSGRRPGTPPLPDALPSWCAVLRERLLEGATGTAFVLVDDELGRDGLISRFEGPDTRIVDLDVGLRDVGPGRIYPELLTLSNIQAALRGESVPGGVNRNRNDLGPAQVLLVRRSDDLWNRLATTPSLDGVARSTLGFLAERDRQSPRLIFFVESEVGNRLRQRLQGRVELLSAYRLPESLDAAWEEAAAWLNETVPSLDLPHSRAALRALGGDLRLVSVLRAAFPERLLFPGALEKITSEILKGPDVQRILRNDLTELPVPAVLLLMLGACSLSIVRADQVETGMVAAEEFRSSPAGKAPQKLVVGKGAPLDQRARNAIRSDLHHNERRIRIEGFSRQHAVEMPPAFRHLDHFLGSERAFSRSGRRLEWQEAATVAGNVVRVHPPFSHLVAELIKEKLPPGTIYRRITSGRSPLEGVSIQEFARLSAGALSEIEPELSPYADMLQLLGTAWSAFLDQREPSPTDLLRVVRAITGRETEILASPTQQSATWKGVLEGPQDVLLGLGSSTPEGGRQHYLLLMPPQPGSLTARNPADKLLDRIHQLGGAGDGSRGRLLVFRPGHPPVRQPDRWVEVSEHDLREAVLGRSWDKTFWSRIRALAGLHSLAPFRSEGALPPGSPIFFGRDRELSYICRNATERSFLIVGSRQIGKTSLLNQIRYKLRQRDDLEIFFIDLQGRGTRQNLRSDLFRLAGEPGYLKDGSPMDLVDHIVAGVQRRSKLPIFLLNEIDLIMQDDPHFLRVLRGFHDEGQARFILTGYVQSALSCEDIGSPFFHWTSSPDGRKYLVLAELSDEAAKDIVGLLEEPPLSLAWESEDEKDRGVRLLLDRSYRIPHLLQAFCLGLIKQLELRGSYRLRESDVQLVVQGSRFSAWEYVHKVNFGALLPHIQPTDKARYLAELLLLTAAKKAYFAGPEPPIRHLHLQDRDPRSLSFDATELRLSFPEILKGLLRDRELQKADELLDRVDLEALLKGFSLTLVLSVDPETQRYFFQSHLYPLEMYRHLKPGEVIDDRIVKCMLGLYSFLN